MSRICPVMVSLLASGVLILCPAPVSAQDVQLTILHTSDLHGMAIPDAQGHPGPGSLARVAYEVEKIRKTTDHPVILLDSGDTLQGTPFEEVLHVRWEEPSPTIEVMNRLGYQAMAVGNHEFNFGLGPLRSAEKQAEFPFLSANSISTESGKPAFPPYMVIKASGIRIGVLGLTTSNIPGWEDPVNYKGLRFEAMDVSAKKWVSRLRNEEGCDLVIVLAHTGFEVDPITGKDNGSEIENFADRLSRIPGIDLLLTGHAHRDLPPMLDHGVIVSEPMAHARRITRIDLKLKKEAGSWKIENFTGKNINVDDTPVDSEIIAEMSQQRKRVLKFLAKPLTQALQPVSIRSCRLEDCAALDLIHQVQLETSGAEISMASLLSDRTPDLPPGPLTRSWVNALYTYANSLRVVSVTGAELVDIMEYAARYYAGLECSGQGPCRLETNPDVRPYNVDTFEGVSYRIDPTAPEGHRIWDVRWHQKALDLHQNFTLVCNNYRAVGGGGFPHIKAKKIIWRSSRLMSDLIAEYLSTKKEWRGSDDGNWAIAPRLGEQVREERQSEPAGNTSP